MAKKPPENREVSDPPEEASPTERRNLAAQNNHLVKRDKPLIVVEARGGTVVAIYGNKKAARVVLVDWDEFQNEGRPGVDYALDQLSTMPADTRSLVDRAVSEKDLGSGAAPE
jgi:hypothetical protein